MKDLTDFPKVVAEHHASLRAYVRSLGVAAHWVDDIAQEVFLLAYQKREQFIEGKEVSLWLRGLARRLVANELRKKARQTRLMHEAITSLLLDFGGPEPTCPLEDRELTDALRNCLSVLPESNREILRRRYEADETSRQIGDALGRSAGMIRQVLQKLRSGLKNCLTSKLGEGWI